MLKQFLHTGVVVADLQQTIDLYQSLGFEVFKQFDKPEPKGKAAMLKQGDTVIELFQFEDMANPQVEFIKCHLAIYSDDLERDIQELVDAGYKLVIPVTEGVVYRYAFLQDPSGAFCYELDTEKST